MIRRASPILLIAAGLVIAGCSNKMTGPQDAASGGATLDLFATGGIVPGQSVQPLTGASLAGSRVDSIEIRGAVLVLKNIVFSANIDSLRDRDSVEATMDDERDDHDEAADIFTHVRFKGPFVVGLMNNQPTVVTVDTIPPGTYNGIRFQIHRLSRKDVMRNAMLPDSLVGFSVVVTGEVMYHDSTSKSFEFRTDINQDFKVRGNFVVHAGDRDVPYALNFNIVNWFRDRSGKLLDPNNPHDWRRIRQEIREALRGQVGFKHGRGDDDLN